MDKVSTINVSAQASKGIKRKAEDLKESKWVPYVKAYSPSKEIETKFMNTPHYMTDSGWLPTWGLQEAVRELLANAIDQARKVAADSPTLNTRDLEFSEEPGRLVIHIDRILLAEVRWKKKVCKYVKHYVNGGYTKAKALEDESEKVETYCFETINYGSFLRWKAFNVGFSTKRGSQSMIGKHGEGLTGASVVLNREGCNFFADCTHYNYTASVLNFDKGVYYQLKRRNKKADLPDNTVRFTIVFNPELKQISPEELMASVRLPAACTAAGVATERGTLLLDAALRGKQFNRSIFVAEEVNCLFGYDFHDPDKNLLQGRDRNAHGKDKCLVECGLILSEAILSSSEVRKKVLKCFLYSAKYNPNSPGDEHLKFYEDIRQGECLSPAAIEALRLHYERDHHAGRRVIFCSRSSSMLKEIQNASDLGMTYCHHVLHNHDAVRESFYVRLVKDARDLSLTSRVGARGKEILALLRVNALKESVMVLPTVLTGFWILNNTAYVTSAWTLGDAEASGLSEEQEVNIHNTLHACTVSVKTAVQIVRLLRNPPDPVLPPLPPTATEEAKKINVKNKSTKKRDRKSTKKRDREDQTDDVSDLDESTDDSDDDSDYESSSDSCSDSTDSSLSASSTDHPDTGTVCSSSDTVSDIVPSKVAKTAGDKPIPAAAARTKLKTYATIQRREEDSICPSSTEGDNRAKNVNNNSLYRDSSRLLPNPPATIYLGARNNIVLYPLSRHLASGVLLYGEKHSGERALVEQLLRVVPSAEDHRRLLKLSELVHIMVFMSSDKAAPVSARVNAHSVSVNIDEKCCGNERMFKYFLHSELQKQEFI